METYSQNLCLIQNNGVGAGFMAYAKINREFIPTMCFPSFAIAAWSLGELYKHLLIKPFWSSPIYSSYHWSATKKPHFLSSETVLSLAGLVGQVLSGSNEHRIPCSLHAMGFTALCDFQLWYKTPAGHGLTVPLYWFQGLFPGSSGISPSWERSHGSVCQQWWPTS